MTFAKLDDALETMRNGGVVLVVDGPDREDEGDLTIAAEHVTPETINFLVRVGGGLLCMPCDAPRLDRLRIGPMVAPEDATCDTAFTVSIDHRTAGSGISCADRAMTIRAAAQPDARPWDFRRPGHVFPLRARTNGVLERPGHTEAAVDLCRLAGLQPCAAICEVLRPDGDVARIPDLIELAKLHRLPLVSVEQLVERRRTVEAAALS